MRDSGFKGLRFKSTRTSKVVTRTTFSPTTRWQHQKSYQFHLLLHSPDGSTRATQLSQFKVCDTFHSTNAARACAQTIGQQSVRMHAAHGSTIIASLMFS
ncbi:hypothetical protein AVEN_9149-1 [Araneus ventricosus]|uniref:Uncharacterized protein n=1 Tax=Araneus ventricosus TaxID=182803 RepID=A0A4Y2L3R1_ARAVE|nr:hypothetical protein AVEN_9149-1 [Araneus ventricosus]